MKTQNDLYSILHQKLEDYEKISNKHWILPHFIIYFFFFLLFWFLFTFNIYQPVTLFFIPTFIILLLLTRYAPSFGFIWLSLFPGWSVGHYFASVGSLMTTESTPFQSPTGAIFGLQFLYGVVICLCFQIDRSVYQILLKDDKFRYSWLRLYATFPVFWCAWWTFIYYVSPFGDFLNWGYALSMMGLDTLTLGYGWWFGVLGGGAFLFALIVNHLVEWIQNEFIDTLNEQEALPSSSSFSIYSPSPKRKYLLLLLLLIFFHTFGSLYSQYGQFPFFQRPVQEYSPSYVQMSCLFNANLQSTKQHLQSDGLNSQVVFWSEESTTIMASQESQFLNDALKLSQQFNVILGLSYGLQKSSSDTTTENRFTLIQASSSNNSKIAFQYVKQHPVPIVEDNTTPGPAWSIPTADLSFGRVGASICFDFNFPTIAQTANENIDIMLQPSATWGPIGVYHVNLNRMQAINYGFTLVRCSSDGVSGIFDPFGQVHLWKYTTPAPADQPGKNNQVPLIMNVPLFNHRPTAYGQWRDILGYFSLAVTGLWAILLLMFKFERFIPKFGKVKKYFNSEQ